MKKSIMCDDMTACYICGTTHNIEIHHVVHGPNRRNSDRYGLIIPLCDKHHTGSNNAVHRNAKIDFELKKRAQIAFNNYYPDLDFLEIFKRSYIDDQ